MGLHRRETVRTKFFLISKRSKDQRKRERDSSREKRMPHSSDLAENGTHSGVPPTRISRYLLLILGACRCPTDHLLHRKMMENSILVGYTVFMQRIYLDNGSTSWPKAPGVGDTIADFLSGNGSNINRGSYADAYETEERVVSVRQALGSLFGCSDPRFVSFTLNVTEALNFLIKGLFHHDDHILVSSMEHNAVMRPLIQSGIAFTRIPADRQGHMIVKGIEELILPTTKAILVTAASNVSGTIQPLQTLSDIARTHHLLFLVDTAQAVPYLDLSGLTADAFAWTGHKGLLGPQGVGGLVLSTHLAEMIDPLVSGGTGSFSDKETIPTVMPDKLEAGTQNLPGILGLGTALSFLATQKTKLRENERDMGSLLLEGLLSNKKISLAGPPSMEGRVPVFSIDVPDRDNADIAFTLSSRYGIETRVGLHCAPAAHKSLGTFPKGTTRFSPGPFTTKDDIQTTLEALKEILDA